MLTLRSENLLKVYRNRAVVNDVSVRVEQGEIVGLLGPNGAGKTTSFYQIVGLIPPDEGKIFLGEIDITELPMYKRSQLGVGYLPQEASVFRNLSVEDNIAAVLEMTSLSRAQQTDRLESLLSEFGLNRVRKSMGNVLSGGERRRTEIARALATDPKFILLDEPFAGIDPIAVEDIQRIVLKLKEKNIGVLITDHNVQETLSITDRAYLLFEGKILKQGTAEELAADEQVRKVYLGQNFVLHKKTISASQQHSSLQDLTPQSLIKYTSDLIAGIERIEKELSDSARVPNQSINDFSRSLSEYKNLLFDYAVTNNFSDLKNLVSVIAIKDTGGNLQQLIALLFGNMFSQFLGAKKWENYFAEVRSQLQRIAAQLQLIARPQL